LMFNDLAHSYWKYFVRLAVMIYSQFCLLSMVSVCHYVSLIIH